MDDRAPQNDDAAEADAPAPTDTAADAEERPLQPSARRRVARRGVRALGGLFAAFALVALVVVGGLAAQLRDGPLDVSRFAPLIETQLSGEIPGGRAEIGGVYLERAEGDGAWRLIFTKVAVSNAEGARVVAAPRMAAEFGLLGALRGEPALDALYLYDVTARIRRTRDGEFVLESDNGAPGADAAGLAALLGAVGGDEAASKSDSGEAIAAPVGGVHIVGADLTYVDEITGRIWRTEDAGARIAQAGSGLSAVLTVAVEGGRFGRQSLEITGLRDAEGRVRARAAFSNLAPADIAGQVRAVDWLRFLDAPVAGEMRLAMDATGNIQRLTGELDAGAGIIDAPGGGQPVRSAGFRFDYDPATDRFRVEGVRIDAARGEVTGRGLVEIERDETGAAVAAAAQLSLGKLAFTLPQHFHAPQDFDAADVTARIDFADQRIEIAEARLGKGDLALSLSGRAWPEGDAWVVEAAIDGEQVTAEELVSLWPRAAAPGGRAWIVESVSSGFVPTLTGAVSIGPGRDHLALDFRVEDVTASPLETFPPVDGGVARGRLTLERMTLDLVEGGVTTPDGARLDLAGSSAVIKGFDQPVEDMVVDLALTGPAASIFAMADTPPLSLISRLGAPLAVTGGQATIAADVGFPLLKALKVEEIAVAAEAILTDIEGALGEDPIRIRARRMALAATPNDMTLTADAEVDGVPVDVKWDENFESGARRIAAKGRATPDMLKRFGVEQAVFTEGAAGVNATVDWRGDRQVIDARLDLTPAALRLDQIGWRKAAGTKASATAKIDLKGDGAISVEGLDFSAPGLSAAGAVSLGATGEIGRVRLSRVKLGDELDLSLSVTPSGGGYVAALGGAYLDAPALIDRLGVGEGEAAEASDLPRVDAELNIARLRLSPKIVVHDLSGRVSTMNSVSAALTGRVGGAAPLSASFTGEGRSGTAKLTSPEAGRLLREAGFFDDGSGGELDLTVDLEDFGAGRAKGELNIRNITIHDDAKLEQMLDGADLAKLEEKMARDGIRFRRVRAPFTWEGDSVRVRRALLRGGDIAVTGGGRYDLDAKSLDMEGTFTPFYGINSAVGKIPLLGKLLTGGKNKGIFAFNFSVKGPADDPRVRVNPLSVLAPGILRELLQAGDDLEETPTPDR